MLSIWKNWFQRLGFFFCCCFWIRDSRTRIRDMGSGMDTNEDPGCLSRIRLSLGLSPRGIPQRPRLVLILVLVSGHLWCSLAAFCSAGVFRGAVMMVFLSHRPHLALVDTKWHLCWPPVCLSGPQARLWRHQVLSFGGPRTRTWSLRAVRTASRGLPPSLNMASPKIQSSWTVSFNLQLYTDLKVPTN